MVTITKHPDGSTFQCDDGDTILRAALRSGIAMPYSCNMGSCGNCRFQLIDGVVRHAYEDAPASSERDRERNRWLGCQAVPQGDCTIKFREDPKCASLHSPAVRSGELLSVAPVTRDISEFTFRIDGVGAFRPGQYALLTVPGSEGARAYSMSNLPGSGKWRFMIKKVPGGTATGYLFDKAKPGERITIDGPYGTAWLHEDSPRDIILLAGGSGLSPMVSVALGAEAAGMLESRKLRLFYGCRDTADLFDTNILGDLAERIEFTAALSEPAADSGWQGATGFLHDVVCERFGGNLPDHEIYFAGPAIMSAAVQKALFDAGVPMDQMHFDEFY
jgi:toluene monooxygenase electron transfer component